MITIGINGFGRIGRCVTRYIIDERQDVKIVKINATGDVDTNMHLLRYDSVHGRWKSEVNGIQWSNTRDIDQCDWETCDVVLECTGAFNDGEKAYKHIENGAKKVVISAPAKNVDLSLIHI